MVRRYCPGAYRREKASRPNTELGYHFDKPAKERMIEASGKLMFGIRTGMAAIAEEAHSNVETFVKHFGYGEHLVARFVKSLIAEAEKHWADIAADHRDNPAEQLRYWIAFEQDRAGHLDRAHVLLARTAAELRQHPKEAALRYIEQYWQAEREWVVTLCKRTRWRDPVGLADKLLLLVHGARNERDAYGAYAPTRMLQQAGDDLIVAHGASPKPAIEASL